MDLSVFILTKDRYENLVAAIKSVQCQSIQPKEIVIVDNGSIDGTPENIIEEFPKINFKLIKLHKNFGIVTGRNIGIKNCAGDIIFFFDDDAELINKKTFSIVSDLFDNEKDVGIVTLNIVDLDNKLKYNTIEKIIETSSFSGGVSFIRKNLFDQIGMFDDKFYNYAEENDFSIRVLTLDYKIVALPEIKILHKVNQKRINNRNRYYSFRNKIIILFRYFPIIYILIESSWIFFGNLINSFKNGWTFLFIIALYEIIFKIDVNRSVIKGNHLIKYLKLKKEPYNKVDCNFAERIKGKMIDILLKIYDK